MVSVHAEPISSPQLRTRVREAVTSPATLLDKAGYWIGLAAAYLGLMSLWYYAAEGKIIAGGLSTPAGVTKQFHGSSIASMPGTSAAWVVLAVCEALVFLGLAIGSLFVLALLVFGDSMTGQHASVPSLFTYIAATVLVIGLVRLMPPYRSARWLSGEHLPTASGETR